MEWLDWLNPYFPTEVALLFGVALIISAGGFYRLVYFVSIGYAFSVTAMAITMVVLFRNGLHVFGAAHCVVLGVYGLRLGTYLVNRERYPAYRRELEDTQRRAVGVTAIKKFVIWVSVSALYVLMVTPCLFNLQYMSGPGRDTAPFPLLCGLAVMVLGLSLESLADRQKSVSKKRAPDRFCNVGLYRLVRCPNYLGEIVFWVGSWIAGLSAYAHWLHWLASLIGLICIIMIMMGSTKRLERKHEERYGDRPEYREYARTVPILIPFVPLFSLKNFRAFLE